MLAAATMYAMALLSPPPVMTHTAARAQPTRAPQPSASQPGLPTVRLTRRQVVPLVASLAASSFARPVHADGDDASARRWISGRSDPIRPTNKEKADGTKKDPKYLSCLNDCVPRCLGTATGTSEIPKERSDCLLECQDECCSTCAAPSLPPPAHTMHCTGHSPGIGSPTP